METMRGASHAPKHLPRRDFLKLSLGAAGYTRLALGGAAGAGLFAAVAPTTPAAAQTGEVIVAMPRPIRAVDARLHVSTEEQQPFVHLYDGLTWMDETLEVQPALAESWESVDPNTWRFTLRQGVKFHNGEDFTAESVKFSFDQYVSMDPPYNYIYLWDETWPPEVEVEGPDSVIIRTPAPSPILLRWITRIGMLPQAALEPGYAEAPIGTGPFKFVEWKLGESVTVEAFEGYWNGAPRIERITWRTIPEAASRLAALQAGEIDLAWDVPPDRLGELTPPDFTVLENPTSQIGTLPINFRNPDAPVADVRVRRALTMAIDGPGLIEALLAGKAIPSRGLAPQVVYAAADTGGYPPRDVEAAKALLAEAGYPDGFELNIMFSPGEFPQDTAIIEAIMGQLSEIGVTANLQEFDGAEFLERIDTPDWDVANDGAGAWMGDAQFFLDAAGNVPGYTSAEVDALIEDASAAGDPKRRVELLGQAQQIVWDDVPFLWSFDRVSLHGLNARVTGAQFIPTNRVAFHKAEITE
jgi:ABC-type transport system substrate-binding protein